MNDPATPRLRPWDGLLLSQLLAIVFLASCLWWVARELYIVLPSNHVTASLSLGQAFGSALGGHIAAFGAMLLLSHLLLGFVAFGLARLTEAACRGFARRGWLIVAWFILLVALVLAANSTWFASSRFTGQATWLRQEVAGLFPVQWMLIASAGALLALACRTFLRVRPPLIGRGASLLGGACLAAAVGYLLIDAIAMPSRAAAASGSPHIVIIGIDSLRDDMRIPRGEDAEAPHIQAFLGGARRFTDATTPLARTYGSWISILTGRHPVTTNARYNLMPRRLVQEGDTLGDALRARGYRTTYATDEVRFANIDRSFGFDRLITPPIGAVDFLLGFGGDMPLVNLVASTTAGRWLFPANHANRAAAVTYDPDDFVRRLSDELSIDGPSFTTIHLTLAHWPYTWAGMSVPGRPQEYRDAYARAVTAVDRQFDAVMRMLEGKGVLDNAVVVVLSDHGEAIGDESDSMLRKTGTHLEIWNSLWGHGTSVLSPHQYQVLIAMRAYGSASMPGIPGRYDWPVSLEDLRPTLEHFVTGAVPDHVDGISLLPFLADPASAATLESRVRFTETDFNTPSSLAGRYEASGLVSEAHIYYELDPESGWVQFREDWLPILIGRKQIAAISRDSLLARVPSLPDGPVQYLYTARRDPLPRRLEGPPDPALEPEAARLWRALQARFPSELPPAAALP